MLFPIALMLYTALTVTLLQEDPEKRLCCLEILAQMREIASAAVTTFQASLEQGREA